MQRHDFRLTHLRHVLQPGAAGSEQRPARRSGQLARKVAFMSVVSQCYLLTKPTCAHPTDFSASRRRLPVSTHVGNIAPRLRASYTPGGTSCSTHELPSGSLEVATLMPRSNSTTSLTSTPRPISASRRARTSGT